MERKQRIDRLIQAPGATGLEGGVAGEVLDQLTAMGAEAWRDPAGNVFGRVGTQGPVVLLMAHMDEVAMMVHRIEDNGMVRLWKIAGVDPRILPGSRLVIHTAQGPLPSVAGALPPHLQQGTEQPAYTWEDLLCDTGLSPAAVKARVQVGDPVTLAPEPLWELLDGRLTGKTLDDRGPLGALLDLFSRLVGKPLSCQAVLCASVQEEKHGTGALTATRGLKPDLAVAVDVCHAPPPTKECSTFPLDSLVIDRSASLHPGLVGLLEAAAKAQDIPFETEAEMAAKGNDAWDIATQAGGVAAALLSVPLRYMHTGAEVISQQALERLESLLEGWILGLDEAQAKEALCWKD